MVGRVGAGALAAVPELNILHLNNVSLMVTGLSTGLVTLLCTSHAMMIVYSVVFGLSIGTPASLCTLEPRVGPTTVSAMSHLRQNRRCDMALR